MIRCRSDDGADASDVLIVLGYAEGRELTRERCVEVAILKVDDHSSVVNVPGAPSSASYRKDDEEDQMLRMSTIQKTGGK